MHQLIGAEQRPETVIVHGPAFAAIDLLFQPVGVVVDEEFAHRDSKREKERGWRQHEIDEGRERDMDARMDEAAGMSVKPFIHILIGGLQIEIRDHMLGHEYGDGSEDEEG